MRNEICGVCGHAVPWANTVYDEGRILCPACVARMGTCTLCEEAKHCAFNEDTDCTLPKMVIRTLHQGNHTIQTQTRNPERIKAICSSCVCWNQEEEFCNRECMNCNKWREVNVENR